MLAMVYKEAKTYREHGVNEYPPGDMCLPFSTGLLLSAFVFSLHTSNIRGGATKLGFVSSACLVLSAAHLLILIAALKSRFADSMRAVPLELLTHARNGTTRALCATTVS